MSIEERIKEVLVGEKEREKSTNFKTLREFYETMKREGLVIKQEYTLPPVDTVGRSLYETAREPSGKEQNNP